MLTNGKSRFSMLRKMESLGLDRTSIPLLFLFFAGAPMLAAQMPGQNAPGPPPAQVEQTSHGIRATAGNEVLEVTVH